jgi:putative copper export protein
VNPIGRAAVVLALAAGALAPASRGGWAAAPDGRPVAPVAQDSTDAAGVGPTLLDAPVLAAGLRGAGVGALMAGTGLLALLAWLLPSGGDAPRRAAIRMLWAGVVVLVLHLLAWLCDAAGSWHLDPDAWTLLTATTAGRAEVARVGTAVVAAVLATWVSRPGAAAVAGLVALVASADIGHAAAIATAWSLPLKALHLWAGAVWLGGLLWLLLADPGRPGHHGGVLRVSAAALIAVLAVTASGLVTALLFLPSARDLLHSAYGGVALAKLAGVGVLVIFGAYHKFVLVPRAATDGAAKLRRSVRYEIGVMILVILLGGLLAYISPPDPGA